MATHASSSSLTALRRGGRRIVLMPALLLSLIAALLWWEIDGLRSCVLRVHADEAALSAARLAAHRTAALVALERGYVLSGAPEDERRFSAASGNATQAIGALDPGAAASAVGPDPASISSRFAQAVREMDAAVALHDLRGSTSLAGEDRRISQDWRALEAAITRVELAAQNGRASDGNEEAVRFGWLLTSALGMCGAAGAGIALSGRSQYLSITRRTARALHSGQASEDRYRVTLQSIADAVIATNSHGQITFMNGVAEELTGWSAGEALGHPLDEVFRAREAVAAVRSTADLLLRRASGHSHEEMVLVARNGEERPVEQCSAPIRGRKGLVSGVVLVFRDVAARQAADVAIRSQRAELETLNRRLRLAMAETHHRVKNNLQIINALVDLQSMSAGSMVPATELKRIGMHIAALAALHELLTEIATQQGDVTQISGAAVLRQLVPLVEGSACGRHIRCEADEVMLPLTRGTSLAMLCNELLCNALRHGRGDIDIYLTGRENVATLDVCDHGPGFPPGFDPERSGKTGFDLVRSIGRHDLGAQVLCANQPDGGARVCIVFPIPAPLQPAPVCLPVGGQSAA